MKFEPHLADGYADREQMRAAAVQLRLDGKSRSQIAKALGFKSGGRTLSEWLKDVPPPEWTKRPNAKDDVRATAVAMRREGCSYRQIQEALGVSKSTLSLWLRDLPLTREERAALEKMRVEGATRRAASIRALHDSRRTKVIADARAQIQEVAESELFVAGVVAYWAEGSKHKPWRLSQQVEFMNSDPAMIRLFIRWLQLLGVPHEDLRFTLSIHESAKVERALMFWMRLVQAPKSQFNKTILKKHNPRTARKNDGEEYNGCLVIRVRKSGFLYREIAGWFEGIAACTSEMAP